jgi:hypothetical protein
MNLVENSSPDIRPCEVDASRICGKALMGATRYWFQPRFGSLPVAPIGTTAQTTATLAVARSTVAA